MCWGIFFYISSVASRMGKIIQHVLSRTKFYTFYPNFTRLHLKRWTFFVFILHNSALYLLYGPIGNTENLHAKHVLHYLSSYHVLAIFVYMVFAWSYIVYYSTNKFILVRKFGAFKPNFLLFTNSYYLSNDYCKMNME